MESIKDIGIENITEEFLLEKAEEMGDELQIDTRQGSVYMDAAKGHIIRAAKFFEDLRLARNMLAEDTCTDEILYEKGKQRGIKWREATPSKWKFDYTGKVPDNGARLFVEGYFFTLQKENDFYVMISELAGSKTNSLMPGTTVIPEKDVAGLITAKLGSLIVPGIDRETNDEFRKRYQEKVAGPSENGNIAHYKTWCESIEGIGRARIIPLWAGNNTVKAILISSDGTSPLKSIVQKVQEYVDPEAKGLGMGVANIGSRFNAVAAIPVNINISASITLKSGYTKEMAVDSIKVTLTLYLKRIALDTDENEIQVIRYSNIGAMLSDAEAVLDYEDLLVNNDTKNIEMELDSVAILGEVSISVNI